MAWLIVSEVFGSDELSIQRCDHRLGSLQRHLPGPQVPFWQGLLRGWGFSLEMPKSQATIEQESLLFGLVSAMWVIVKPGRLLLAE